MSNESTIQVEEKDICKKKSVFDTIKSDKNNNYSSYAALIGVLLTISGIIVKGISAIVIEGYNSYFSINGSYAQISEANIFSNLFDLLFKGLILLLFNYFMGYIIIRTHGFWKTVRNVVCIYLVTMVALFIFACVILDYNIIKIWKDVTALEVLKCLRSLFILCTAIYYFGLSIGIALKNQKFFTKPIDKAVDMVDKKTNTKKTGKKVIIALIAVFVIVQTFCFFKLGESFAALKRDYRLIDNNTKVILAEKDGTYLCANCKYDEKSNYLEIYSSKQVCIDTENVEMNVINVFGVNVDKGK